MEESKDQYTVNDRRIQHDGSAAEAPEPAPEPGPQAAQPAPEAAAPEAAAPEAAATEAAADEGEGGARAESQQAEKERARDGFSMAAGGETSIDFTSFAYSLGHAALIFMGLEANPDTGEKSVHLEAARQHIDILGMLEDKTRGNLSAEEQEFMDKLLYTLRLSFVEVSRTQTAG